MSPTSVARQHIFVLVKVLQWVELIADTAIPKHAWTTLDKSSL